MKKLLLGAAISAVMLSNAANAAIPVVGGKPQFNAANTSYVFLSGASAARKFIEKLFADTGEICDAGTTVFKYKDSINGKKQNAYLCELNPTLGVAKPNLLIYKRSDGGSAQGVSPVIAGTAIEFLNIPGVSRSGLTNVGAGSCGTVNASNEITCDYNLSSKYSKIIPDFGISDVDPSQFVGENKPAGFSPVSKADLALLTVKPTAALTFGVPVTTSLRNALQAAQLGSACVGSETEACMPSLSKHQIASIHTGKLKSWTDFKVGNDNLVSLANAADVPGNNRVHICRRVNGSGTQAQHGIKFLNYPCTGAATPPAAGNNFPEGVPATQVHALSSSGDVTDCLNELQTATNAANGFNNLYTAGGKRWAIGIQSLEKNADRSDDFRFVKVDGVAPTLENVANGTYNDWAELTFQYNNGHFATLSSDVATIATEVIESLGNPTVLASLNSGFVHGFGASGYLAVPQFNTVASNAKLDLSAPVNPYSHGTANAAVNNCRVPTIYNDQINIDVLAP